MPRKSEQHYSNGMLSAAERAQNILRQHAIGQKIVNFVAGSKSQNYQQVMWASRGIDFEPSEIRTLRIEGDPNASALPKSWNRVALFALNAAQLNVAHKKYGETAYPTVGYEAGKILHVGIPVENQDQPHGTLEDDPERVGIGMRVGKGALNAFGGLWLPSRSTFIQFPMTQIQNPDNDPEKRMNGLFDIEALAKLHPDVRVY